MFRSNMSRFNMIRQMLTAALAAIALLVARPVLAADAKQMEENKKTGVTPRGSEGGLPAPNCFLYSGTC